MGVKAKIEQSAPNRPPTMGDGDVDASLLWEWFTKAENFLRHKGTAEKDMVKTVAYGTSGVHAIRWLAAAGPTLCEMSWDDYKDQMCSLYLPSDWEYTARMSVLRLKQGPRPFMDFALDLMGKNNLLAGTSSFLNDNFVRDAIEAGMEPDLAAECHRENTNCFMDFRPWLDEVKRLDERRRQRFDEIAKEFARLNLRTTVPGHAGARAPLRSSANQAGGNITGSSPTFVPIPKLLPEEQKLLSDNGGCFKCRRFFANHIGPRCPNPPIDGAKYKTLTAKDVPPRPSNFAPRPGSAPAGRVAAVVGTGASIEEELINFDSNVEMVAAVLPNIVSSVVDTGSPDYSDDECALFSCSNLFWSCILSSPSSASPLEIKGLIDDGSSVVLIKEAVARSLGLPFLQASEPFNCQAAFSSTKTSLSLSSFVKITPVSPDGRFTSRTLRAFVSPTLVTDLILGLLFLTSNSLLVDHGSSSCIVRLDNDVLYNLLNPGVDVPSKPLPPWKSAYVRASDVRAAHRRARPLVRDVLLGPEMSSRLRERRKIHPSRDQHGSAGGNIVCAIKERIEDLNAVVNYEAQLKRLDAEMKKKYGTSSPTTFPQFTTFPTPRTTASYSKTPIKSCVNTNMRALENGRMCGEHYSRVTWRLVACDPPTLSTLAPLSWCQRQTLPLCRGGLTTIVSLTRTQSRTASPCHASPTSSQIAVGGRFGVNST